MTLVTSVCSDCRWLPAVIFMLSLICAAGHGNRDCLHGFMLPDGTCECYSCWTGDTCSQYASSSPTFARSSDTAVLASTDDDAERKHIYTAMAQDPDKEFCKDPEGCACSNVTYFIVSQSETSSFQIDKYTGDITANGDSLTLYSEYQLVIGAIDDGHAYNTMDLVVHGDQSWDRSASNKYLLDMSDDVFSTGYSSKHDGEPHSRHKRATTPVTLPGNVTFTLSKYGLAANLTEIRVGLRIQFRLDIVFPLGPTDIQVELFAPDSDNIIMTLCNVLVTAGGNLAVTGSQVPVMESLDGSQYNDRAIIQLGTVSNSASNLTDFSPSTMSVTYEAIMLENSKTTNGQDYWVSAGAEYNNEMDVWVGQASFTAKIDDDSANFTETPTVSFTGETSLAIGSCANYTIDLTLNRPVVNLTFDLFPPLNVSDVMSICTAKIVSVNSAYTCGVRDFWDYNTDYIPDGTSLGFKRAHIDMGRPINKLAREYKTTPTSAYKGQITFGVQVCMNDNPGLVTQTYSLGSAIQIGSQIVWAGQLAITAMPKLVSQHVTPMFNMSFVSGNGISQSKPVILQLDMEVPENTYGDYTLEVMAPVKDGMAIFQVCTVRMVFVGENMACLSQRNIDVVYDFSSNNTISIYPDVAKANIGTITNLGTLGWTHSNFSDSRNTVTFNIMFKATDHPDCTVGSVHDVFFGMFVGTDKLTIGKISVTVQAEIPATTLTDNIKPQINISMGGDGSNVIALKKTSQVLLDITTARNTIYSPFSIEFVMPNNSGVALIKICKVQVISVGANNPCVVAAGVERAVSMVSSFNDGIIDRAVINMFSLCNVQQVDDEAEDHIVLAANMILMNNIKFTTDNSTWVNAGIMYNNAIVNLVRLSVQASLNNKTSSVSTVPYLGIVPNNGNLTSIPWGYPARYLVRIKVAPNDSTPLSLNVTTMDNALSICSIRLVRAGDGLPCLDLPVVNIINQDQHLGINRGGNIDLGFTTNVGTDPLTSDDDWDSNTIEVELVAKMTFDSTQFSDGSTHDLKFVLNYNPNYSSQQTKTVTVTATSDTSMINSGNLENTTIIGSMKVASITGQDTPLSTENVNTIVRSESKRFVISVNTVLNSTSNLTVTMTTPTTVSNVMEIVYIGLLDAGDNLPCVATAQTMATYEPRQANGLYNDIGALNLGYVCNIGTITNDTTGTANQVRVEGVIRLLGSSKLSPGYSMQIHSAINFNNKQMMVYSLSLTVGDDTTYLDIYQDRLNDSAGIAYNSTEDPIFVGISQIKTIPLVATIPPFTSSKVRLDAVMPVSTSAIITVIDLKVVGSGRNIPNLEKYQDDYTVTNSSQFNTSQITKCELNMGVVSNSGVTYQNDQNMTDDDTISLEAQLQMTDNVLATDQSKHKVSFGLQVTGYIFILEIYITVRRTGNETIDFNVSSVVDLANSTSNLVEIDTIFKLSNTSTAEGQDSILNIFLPDYVAYVSTVVTSPNKTLLSVNNVNNAVTLSFGTLYFSDEVHLRTTISSNSSHPVPLSITGHNSVFSIQPVANTNTANDTAGDMEYANFTIATTPKGSSECAPSDLGMASGIILDCQISSSDDSISDASQGRYNTGTGWSPFVDTGKVREERYFQVYFGNQVLVTKIKVKQGGPSYAVTLDLRYSNDGIAWTVSDNHMYPTAGAAEDELNVPSPQVSRYLRIMITAMDDEKQKGSFNFELVGCVTNSDGPANLCPAVSSTRLPDFSTRTFIRAGSTLYVCTGIQSTKGVKQACYSTADDRTFQALDSRVGCLLGYDSLATSLYAISSNGLTYMVSLDGVQWFSLAEAEVTKARALPTFKDAIKVPRDGNVLLNKSTPDSSFIDSNYGAIVDGIMVNRGGWTTIFTWGQCCP